MGSSAKTHKAMFRKTKVKMLHATNRLGKCGPLFIIHDAARRARRLALNDDGVNNGVTRKREHQLCTDVRQALLVFSIKAAEFVVAEPEQFGCGALLITCRFQGRPYQFDFTTSDYCLEIRRRLVT